MLANADQAQASQPLGPARDADLEEGKSRSLSERQWLLVGTYCVLFTRYCVATFLSSFFTPWATQAGISGTMNGVIFAAYPFGMAMTSFFAPQAMGRLGTRASVSVGLSCTCVLTLVFGLIPDAVGGGSARSSLFALCYALNGATGALAETSCIIMVSNRYQDSLGTVMASLGTVSGVGCMVGPVIGGILFDLPTDAAWSFRLPFVVLSVGPLTLLPLVPLFMPEAEVGVDLGRRIPALRDALSPSSVLGLLSVSLSGIVVATLDPTLSYRLSSPPFRFSPSVVSFFFMYSTVVYVAVSIPVGYIVDRYPANSRVFKGTTAAGFAVLGLTFFLLGPFGLCAWGLDAAGEMQQALNHLGPVATALVLKGVGSALSNNAVYPDLVIGLELADASLHATVSALWNGAYAVGWAAGPLVGGALYDTFAAHPLCTGDDALPPTCLRDHAPQAGRAASPSPPRVGAVAAAPLADGSARRKHRPPPPPRAPHACSCEWVAQNGFDGFASSVAVFSFAFALLLGLAACANVRGRAASRRALGHEDERGWPPPREGAGPADDGLQPLQGAPVRTAPVGAVNS